MHPGYKVFFQGAAFGALMTATMLLGIQGRFSEAIVPALMMMASMIFGFSNAERLR